ncbi:MAG: acetate/propionate family kinase [Phycisphaeraceae bacterium JB051]
MLILVANLGSTSFKYKLYDLVPGDHETALAEGAADRLGLGASNWSIKTDNDSSKGVVDLADHAQAIDFHFKELINLGVIDSIDAVDAIGFKAVHGGPISGAVKVDDQVIDTMQDFADVAPAHNPPYIAAMKAFAKQLPSIPQVAAFETAFHQSIPMSRQVYGIPYEWTTDLGIRRYGFHGASHRYIATRMPQLDSNIAKVINCHLGGSCSICAIENGKSVANSFGMTAQSGTFHASRVGDFDAFALMKLLTPESGLDLETIWKKLGKESGLLGISGVSSDMREVIEAADAGNDRAKLAFDAFVETCRHYVGSYLAVLNGADALVFTGGIGQHSKVLRKAVCANLDFAGIKLDVDKNESANGNEETAIHAADSKTQIWVVPTNEELIVARQTFDVLNEA